MGYSFQIHHTKSEMIKFSYFGFGISGFLLGIIWRIHQDSGVRGILEAVNRNRAQDAGVRDSYDPLPQP
jgi:hypothetical protein